jgi:electron transfer flavoprotein alpha/beta subunit
MRFIETSLPALVTVSRGEMVRRIPSFTDFLDSRQKPLKVITASDLNLAEEELGLSGSVTQCCQCVRAETKGARKNYQW